MIKVGDQLQIYNKGDAYVGCLVAFGNCTSIDEDLNSNKCYEIEGYEGSFNQEEYDVVLVSLENAFFKREYQS